MCFTKTLPFMKKESTAKSPIEKILNFNDREISLVLADGQWWVAVKPVCEALGVDYLAQYKNLQEEEILGQLLSNQTIVAADKRERKMVCIPEMFVYGWLFSIRSDSPGLRQYKVECYRALYTHFHGRFSQLIERMRIDDEKAELELRLASNEDYQKLMALEERRKKIAPALKKMDAELLKGQTRFDFGSQ